MGNISRNTFDRLKHYVSVRLQQGVPLVDADWNEKDDIRKYELQAFLKWFVGDGVPLGNDGFEIVALSGMPNDFRIRGGDGTPEGAGRCLVAGWDVVSESDINYSAQALTDAAKATALGVPRVTPLSTPTASGDYTAYLDMWEREVLPGEIGDDAFVYDRNLINEDIGLPTCTRFKREWVVRVVAGTTLPAPAARHVHYPLARIARRTGDPNINTQDITDLRRVGLQVGSYHDTQQIVRDAFGTTYTLDGDAAPNLKLSLREAINVLLKGGVPATPPSPVTDNTVSDKQPCAVVGADGDVWVFWHSTRSSNTDIRYRRYSRASSSWGTDTQLTAGTNADMEPAAVVDTDGDIWVFWHTFPGTTSNYDIRYRRYSRATSSWGAESSITAAAGLDRRPSAIVGADGDIWVFWESNRGGNFNIWCRRYSRATAAWGVETQLTTDVSDDELPTAVVGANGDVWVFWHSTRIPPGSPEGTVANADIRYRRYSRATASWGVDSQLTEDRGLDQYPRAICDANGDIWVFWRSDRLANPEIWCRRYSIAAGSWVGTDDTQLTSNTGEDSRPFAVLAADGDILLFWESDRSGNWDIWCKRYSRDAGWGADLPLTIGAENNEDSERAYALADGDGYIWAFWNYLRTGGTDDYDIRYRKLIPQV